MGAMYDQDQASTSSVCRLNKNSKYSTVLQLYSCTVYFQTTIKVPSILETYVDSHMRSYWLGLSDNVYTGRTRLVRVREV